MGVAREHLGQWIHLREVQGLLSRFLSRITVTSLSALKFGVQRGRMTSKQIIGYIMEYRDISRAHIGKAVARVVI